MKHQSKVLLIVFIGVLIFSACSNKEPNLKTFYVNSISGNDVNDGTNHETAWKSLERASENIYKPGEKLFLSNGVTFKGKLNLKGGGSKESPVIVSGYDSGDGNKSFPVINAKGYVAGIQIQNGRHFIIGKLEITADAGDLAEPEAQNKRYGVYISANEPGEYSNIHLHDLHIHHIFASENIQKDGAKATSNIGYGIYVQMQNKEAKIKNIKIDYCNIEMTGHTGIRLNGAGDETGRVYLDSITIENNYLKNIGGPGMVPGTCENVVVRGNVTDHTGSSIDARMHARGSGIWTWTCNNVLIEKNKFMHAHGKADSHGAHIDFNCKNVVVQHNLSLDNAGGFVEILGNNHNCCYRYNISINDGFRVKGENGASQEGKVLWTSGYVGRGNKKNGPYNSYIYNNTVFVKEGSRSCFSFTRTTEGILIANNIFYIQGKTVDVSGDQDTQVEDKNRTIENAIFKNNLFQKSNILPGSLIIKDSEPLIGNPMFTNPGGLIAEDYIPQNMDLIKDKGIKIEKIPGDEIGLTIGLEVESDYFGNAISGLPDIGAIEL
ncbi:MAG: right-handed parallel beta-helix repeat-containing protein [Prolixibacteraceae bacterium]|nr:right-handed parallel beta-helix repeat-containing protein [Prolixibacteraceae bacterium]MBT6997166.1 right-handed parallel beta-helix repeat-containing protein [Prolixibacteraceae bacterium]